MNTVRHTEGAFERIIEHYMRAHWYVRVHGFDCKQMEPPAGPLDVGVAA
jgi:hypothetical protein